MTKTIPERPYHYTECGLDYVYLSDGYTVYDSGYGPAVEVHNAAQLDREIALEIVRLQGPLTGQEVRFLRGLMDLTQQELGTLLGKDAQSVARWEKSKTAIPRIEDIALRQIYLEKTGHSPKFVDTAQQVAAIDNRLERVEFSEKKGKWTDEAAA